MLQCSQVMVNSAEKVRLAGNQNVMVCERGTMFGYSKFSSVCFFLLTLSSWMKASLWEVIFSFLYAGKEGLQDLHVHYE